MDEIEPRELCSEFARFLGENEDEDVVEIGLSSLLCVPGMTRITDP